MGGACKSGFKLMIKLIDDMITYLRLSITYIGYCQWAMLWACGKFQSHDGFLWFNGGTTFRDEETSLWVHSQIWGMFLCAWFFVEKVQKVENVFHAVANVVFGVAAFSPFGKAKELIRVFCDSRKTGSWWWGGEWDSGTNVPLAFTSWMTLILISKYP